ncbi:MAG: J domain-containing protein [Thermodesulfobacteriota bacterium]
MAASKKNPFEVFGLTAEMAGRLSEADLFLLIKAMYRTLQKLHHPDKSSGLSPKEATRNAERAVEINLAYEKLDLEKNADSFHHQMKLYQARRQRQPGKRIPALEKEIKLGRQRQHALSEGFMLYLLRSLPWQSDNGLEPGCLLQTPVNVKLGLNDVAINQNVRSASWKLGSNYKEIIFDPLGGMYYRPVGRAKPFPVNYIHILGVIKTDQIDLVPLLDREPPREGCFKCPALDSRYGINGAPLKVRNTIVLDKFKSHCLPLLRPDLTERSYLFSIHRPLFDSEGKISLEGVIVKISRP